LERAAEADMYQRNLKTAQLIQGLTDESKTDCNLTATAEEDCRPQHMFQDLERDFVLMFRHQNTAVLPVSLAHL
jgi:hypothetical protein